jgi:hypothetical protein
VPGFLFDVARSLARISDICLSGISIVRVVAATPNARSGNRAYGCFDGHAPSSCATWAATAVAS